MDIWFGADAGAWAQPHAPLGNGYLFTDEAWALGDENALRARVDLRFFPSGGGGVPAEEMIFGEERHRLLFHCGFSHNRKRWGERGADALTVALLDRNARGPCVWVRSRVFETQHGFKVQGRQSAWPVGAFFSPSSKCLVRLMAFWHLVLHFLHSKRRVIFLVVLAFLWKTGLV